MKKYTVMVFSIFVFVLFSVQTYAFEISVGLSSPNIGASILRGEDAETFISDLNALGVKTRTGVALSPIRFDLMVEIMPFLAIETGVELNKSFIRFDSPETSDTSSLLETEGSIVLFQRNSIAIPLMLRAQFDFSVAIIYASIGPKFFIPLGDYVSIDNTKIKELPTGSLETRDFSVDLSVALGAEVRLGSSNYLGLRVGYDLNVLSPIKSIGGNNNPSFFHDSFGASLTYRYAFNSKWKKA